MKCIHESIFLTNEHKTTINMQVIINDLSRTYSIPVESHTTVHELKSKIQSASGCPIDQQNLVDNTQKIPLNDNNKTVSDYNIQNESRLNLALKLRGGGMQVFVKLITGHTMTLDVELSDSIEQIKQTIVERGWVPDNCEVVILHHDRELEDSRLLSDYNVKPEDTIQIRIRIRGG